MQLDTRQSHIADESSAEIRVEDQLGRSRREVETYATVMPRSMSSHTKG
jgi:hypothetical protein